MKIYLAGKPEDHKRFNKYAQDLQNRNLTVVSSWHENGDVASVLEQKRELDTNRKGFVAMAFTGATPSAQDRRSVVNPKLEIELDTLLDKVKSEIESADLVIADIEGGSIEAGYALASDKALITLGPLRSPLSFYYVGEVEAADDWTGVLAIMYAQRDRQLKRTLKIDKEPANC